MAVHQLYNRSLSMPNLPSRRGFSMPPLECANSVYKALGALKREFDSTPSLRDYPDEIIARHGNFKYQRIGRDVLLLPATPARNEGGSEEIEAKMVIQRPDASVFGYPVERDLFRVGSARNEGITSEERRAKGAESLEDYGDLKCQGPSGDMTPRPSKLNSDEGDEESFSCFENVKFQYFVGRVESFRRFAPRLVRASVVATPPSPSPAGPIVPRKNKPRNEKENFQPGNQAHRIRRKPVPAFVPSPKRPVLRCMNPNISTLQPDPWTPPRDEQDSLPATPPRKLRFSRVSPSSPDVRPYGMGTFGMNQPMKGRPDIPKDPFALPIHPNAPSPYTRPRLRLISSPSPICQKPAPVYSSPCSPMHTQIPPRPLLSILDFDFHCVLGKGGQGIVYLAKHKSSMPTDRRHHAIKFIAKSRITCERDIELILLERQILQILSIPGHPNIMNLDASFHDDKYFYLVNEACTGGDMHAFLAHNGRFPEDVARFYFGEMVLGIEFLHQHSIIHRDLKLMNVFMKSDGHIVIGDMGLIRCFLDARTEDGLPLGQDQHYTRQGCGTLTHMAPEVFTIGVYTYGVDWWALGVMLYHMLFGTLPFISSDERELCQIIAKQEPFFPVYSQPECISPLATSVMKQLLAKRPGFRLDGSGIRLHPFSYGIPWSALHKIEAPFRPRPAQHFLERGLNPASIPIPGRNYFPDEDPFPQYNYIGPGLQAWVEEEVGDAGEDPDFGNFGNRMSSSTSDMFGERAHTEDFSMKRDVHRAPRPSSSCFMVCYRPSLEANDDNLGTIDGVGENDETNQSVHSNHEVAEAMGDNHGPTETIEATNDHQDVTEAVINDSHGAYEAVDTLDANEATDDHQETHGDEAPEVMEPNPGEPEPIQPLGSVESDVSNEIDECSGWMDGFESVIVDDEIIIFFTDSTPRSTSPEPTPPEPTPPDLASPESASPESASPEPASPESASPEPTLPASIAHLEQPRKIRRVHPRLEYFPISSYPANWTRLPSDPPSLTESEDDYDAGLSGIVFYDGDVPYILPEDSNVAFPAATLPIVIQGTLDESDVGGLLNTTLVNSELRSWFNSDTWTAPSPSLGLISLSGSSGNQVIDPNSASSSQEEYPSSVQTFDTLIAHRSHGSTDFKIAPCPLTLFDPMVPPFGDFYTNDTLETPPQTEMDIVDLHWQTGSNPSDVGVSASGSYPEQNLPHLARRRRWIDRAVGFVASLTRSIGWLRFSRSKREPCSDSMV